MRLCLPVIALCLAAAGAGQRPAHPDFKPTPEQDRVLFGSDGSPDREVDQFWTPHWRFCETDDEHFDHPAQMLSPLGAPLQGRWRIYGVFLPDDVLRKIYYRNALKYLPSLRASIERQLAERSR